MANGTAGGDTATELTRELVRINSENPTGNERACAAFVADWLRRAGAEVTIDEVAPGRPNVVARLKGGNAPALAYIAHMDTVPAGDGWTVDPFAGTIKDGRLYGRGAADMKGGLAAVMIAMKQMIEWGVEPSGDFLLCATVDEEGAKMLGAVRLVERGLIRPDTRLVATEPTGLSLVVAQKGVMWYRVETHGKMAHAGNPTVGADAIHGLAAAIIAIKQHFGGLPHQHPLLGRPSATVGRIAGGFKTNVVPDHAWAEIDTRLVPPQTTAETEQAVRELVERSVSTVAGVSGKVSAVTIDRPPVEARADSPLLMGFAEAFAAETGGAIEHTGFPAYTDAAIISAITGNRHCVLFGPGHLAQAHTADEFVPVDQLETAARILARAARILLTS